MQVKSIAKCSKGSILKYFQPSLSYHLSLRSLFCLLLSGSFTQVLLYCLSLYGPRCQQTCLRGFEHQWPCLISTFVIRFLENIISKLAAGEISIIMLVSAAEEIGLSVSLTETPKTVFVTSNNECRRKLKSTNFYLPNKP